MKAFLGLVAAVVICIAVAKLLNYANILVSGSPTPPPEPPAPVSSDPWPCLDPKIKDVLAKEKNKGAVPFKEAIDKCSRAQWLKDPWLANYQVDYAILISMRDPVQATKVVSEVRNRIPTNSPVYPRVMVLKL